MGVFVDYPSDPFPDLRNVETTILTANTHPLLVSGLIVCNRTNYKILVNLKKIRIQTAPIPLVLKTGFIINNFEIEPYDTVDIVAKKGLKIYLNYSSDITQTINDSLVIFSNGYTQIFDCEISYITLNDLPLPPTP